MGRAISRPTECQHREMGEGEAGQLRDLLRGEHAAAADDDTKDVLLQRKVVPACGSNLLLLVTSLQGCTRLLRLPLIA